MQLDAITVLINVLIVILNLGAVVLTIGRFSSKIETEQRNIGDRLKRIERWIDGLYSSGPGR